jgi:RNA-directed DNA polymerase
MGTCGIIFFTLLANIALQGMETPLRGWALKAHLKKSTPILVRYVNNFVILHQSKEVIEQAQTFLGEWLKCMGLKLHLDKTQIINTDLVFNL